MVEPILKVSGVYRNFGRKEDWIDKAGRRLRGGLPRTIVKALNGVDLSIRKGEIFGIAGESGCGKSTLGRVMVGLMPPTSGEVTFKGQPVMNRGKSLHLGLQMVFQDAGAALNPRLRVMDLIGEGAMLHGKVKRKEIVDFVAAQLELVGLTADAMKRYPHQFSGGQRQRINIARALALEPDLIVCDESVAALDVSVQAQILNLFLDLKERLDLTYVFISHDLSVLRHIADRTAVMYLGKVVEEGPTSDLFERPRHPYTRALLDNAPQLSRRHQTYHPVPGEVPSATAMPSGCPFHTRCPVREHGCAENQPQLIGPVDGHRYACPVVYKELTSERL